jgi:catechol 2,3-dioxygenase-like lactoylglutathione lyase family enzyme
MTQLIKLKSLAPILMVEAIEPVLPFWVDRLGFSLTTTVPEAGPYNFAIASRDGIEVMLQTRASAAEDLNADLGTIGAGVLYLSVAALDPVLAALGDADIVVARRTTFYGADEVFVRDPAGNLVGIAAFA